ncbi:Dual oxidase 1 [Folsomia candida]|uniref:Dual oxidase 1 n=1 Tax=Folsomia candida TaxID=158441 RepID=A0A226F0X3_FOLCA|nr:Dual oxidase 1 [Folsomia candida]
MTSYFLIKTRFSSIDCADDGIEGAILGVGVTGSDTAWAEDGCEALVTGVLIIVFNEFLIGDGGCFIELSFQRSINQSLSTSLPAGYEPFCTPAAYHFVSIINQSLSTALPAGYEPFCTSSACHFVPIINQSLSISLPAGYEPFCTPSAYRQWCLSSFMKAGEEGGGEQGADQAKDLGNGKGTEVKEGAILQMGVGTEGVVVSEDSVVLVQD